MNSQKRALKLFALLSTVCLFAASCVGTASGSEDAESLPVELPSWDDDPWDDDYNHFLVQMDDSAESAEAEAAALVEDAAGPKMLWTQQSPGDFTPIDPNHPLAGNGDETTTTTEKPKKSQKPKKDEAQTKRPKRSKRRDAFFGHRGIHSRRHLGGRVWAIATDLNKSEVEELSGVEGVWLDHPLVLFEDSSERDLQWYLDNQGQTISGSQGTPDADINAPDVWGTSTGAGIVVAVVDTGMQLDHPDLRNQLWTNSGEICGNGVDDDRNGYVDDCHGANVVNQNGDVTDQHGHGTHIAGTIAAETDNGIGIAGIAPDARLMAVKTGNGSSTMSAGIAGIRYAVDNGAQIMNLSWGTQAGTPINAVPPLSDAIEYARQNGVLVVIAAGNSSANIDQQPVLPASYGHDNVMTIGASTNTDGMAYFSNYGPVSVDLFSPGLQIRATMPGSSYGWMSGTSMASPTVAATAALVWSAHPEYSYADVKQAIMFGAAARPAFNGKSVVAARTDAVAAVGEGNQDLSYTFGGFNGLEPGQAQAVSVEVAVASDASVDTSGVSLRATLLKQYNGQIYGVADHTVLLGANSEVTTNEYAEITVAPSLATPGNATSVELDLQLPEGNYGLLVEVVKGSEATGVAGLVSFTVGSPAPDVTTTTAPNTGGPTPTTQAPGAPTTQAPQQPGVTTTQPPNGGGGGGGTATTSPPVTNTTQPGAGGGGGTSPSPTSTTAPSNGGTTTSTAQPPSGGGGGGGGGGGVGGGGGGGSTGGGTATTSPPVTNTTQPGAGGGGGTSPSPTTTTTPGNASGIQSVTPNWGQTSGGTLVNVTGSGFAPGAQVLFDGQPATVVFQQGDYYLLAYSPGHAAGSVSVSVMNTDGSEIARANAFTYVQDGQVPSTPTTQPGSGGGTGGGGSTPTTQAPSPGTPTTQPGTPTTQVPTQPVTSTTQPGTITTQPPHTWPPYTIEGPQGLTLVPLHPDRKASKLSASILANAACASASCEGLSL